MALAVRSSSVLPYSSHTNPVITAPAGIQDGDILVIWAAIGNATPPTPTPPAGFTVATGFPAQDTGGGFTVKDYVWTKTASSESGNYTVTQAVSNSELLMFAVSGGSTGLSPNPTINVHDSGVGGGVTTTMLGLTAAANSLIVVLSQDFGDTSNNLSPPTGTTPTFTTFFSKTTGGAVLTLAASGVYAPGGPTGDKTMTNNNGTGVPWGGFMLAFAPPAGIAALAPRSTIVRQAVNRASTY